MLADRKNSGKIGGTKRVNGYDMTPMSFARISAYAEQFDEHIDTTSVIEALRFSARLRLEADVPHAQREAFVAGVADALELTDIADRSVASLAPGELKRLSLGVELASNPSILFAVSASLQDSRPVRPMAVYSQLLRPPPHPLPA